MYNSVLQTLLYQNIINKSIPSIKVRSRLIHTSLKSILFAQPTATSHAHLLKHGEVTPGISSEIYFDRRLKLLDKIIKNSPSSENDRSHLVIIPSASVQYMSEKIPYRFRQNSDFLYLSGFKEPDSVLVLTTSTKKFPDFNTTLFIPKQASYSVQWEGRKMDLTATADFLAINKALYMFELENFLQNFMNSHTLYTVWYDYLNVPPFTVHQIMRDFMATCAGNLSVESPRSSLHQLRLIKSDAEMHLMRNTCHIAASSLKEVMKFSKYSNLESELDAKMEFECRMKGADYSAFPPVVAGGDRANTIHYIENNQIISERDLILMDAGCECHGYSSDLSRTWPISGKFSDPQRELYQIVLSVQEHLINLCKSKLSLDHLFKIMCKKLGHGLQELNIIPKKFSDVEAIKAAYAFCPHHSSHYLGMDVHDTATVSRGIVLEPGMVVTIEPGVYISKNNKTVPEKYRGLCVRIEDDILITEDGCEVLTRECPKQIEEIEELFWS